MYGCAYLSFKPFHYLCDQWIIEWISNTTSLCLILLILLSLYFFYHKKIELNWFRRLLSRLRTSSPQTLQLLRLRPSNNDEKKENKKRKRKNTIEVLPDSACGLTYLNLEGTWSAGIKTTQKWWEEISQCFFWTGTKSSCLERKTRYTFQNTEITVHCRHAILLIGLPTPVTARWD